MSFNTLEDCRQLFCDHSLVHSLLPVNSPLPFKWFNHIWEEYTLGERPYRNLSWIEEIYFELDWASIYNVNVKKPDVSSALIALTFAYLNWGVGDEFAKDTYRQKNITEFNRFKDDIKMDMVVANKIRTAMLEIHDDYAYTSIGRLAIEINHWYMAAFNEKSYIEVVQKIRYENIHMTDIEFAKYRMTFINRFLNKKKIFNEIDANDGEHLRAKKYLNMELSALKSIYGESCQTLVST